MIVELIHNSHPIDDEPKKIVDAINITDINQLSYRINEVNEEFSNIVFVVNKGERDIICPIEIKGKSVDALSGDCRLIYKKISQLLENNNHNIHLIIDYQNDKLFMLEYDIREIQL